MVPTEQEHKQEQEQGKHKNTVFLFPFCVFASLSGQFIFLFGGFIAVWLKIKASTKSWIQKFSIPKYCMTNKILKEAEPSCQAPTTFERSNAGGD